jgi:hypothetical protein
VVLDDVEVGNDLEQFGLDQGDDGVVVVLDEGFPFLPGGVREGLARKHLALVDVVDGTDRVVEARGVEERPYLVVETRFVVDLDGVVHGEFVASREEFECFPAALVGAIEVAVPEEFPVAVGLGNTAVVGEPDRVETGVGGGRRHRWKGAAVGVRGVDVEVRFHVRCGMSGSKSHAVREPGGKHLGAGTASDERCGPVRP